jgi:hypothetical protein
MLFIVQIQLCAKEDPLEVAIAIMCLSQNEITPKHPKDMLAC